MFVQQINANQKNDHIRTCFLISRIYCSAKIKTNFLHKKYILMIISNVVSSLAYKDPHKIFLDFVF